LRVQVASAATGFLLLGRLIEVVTKCTYAEFVRGRILDAVQWNDPGTGAYLGFDIPRSGHATGYTRRWSRLGLFISLLPDPAHLRSNEGAWIRYRPFQLNGAAYGGLKGNVLGWAPLLRGLATRDRRLLTSEAYDAFFAPQTLKSVCPRATPFPGSRAAMRAASMCAMREAVLDIGPRSASIRRCVRPARS
jgi:CubicO group peptidase (beta-lactamase class C family)